MLDWRSATRFADCVDQRSTLGLLSPVNTDLYQLVSLQCDVDLVQDVVGQPVAGHADHRTEVVSLCLQFSATGG